MSKQQSGFTLIELVVVIVILGLLAATALPRFVNVTSQARVASLQGVAGAVRSGAALARAQVLVSGSNGGSMTIDGASVTVNSSGYPVAATGGIDNMVTGVVGQGYSYSGGEFVPDNGGSAGSSGCNVAYNENTGTATIRSSGCP